MAINGVKFKAYPTKEQEKVLSQWIGCSRVIYNCKVEEDQQNYKTYKETGQKISIHQAYSHFKTTEREWLSECPSQILRNSASNWYTAKQRSLKGIAKHPKKKKKGIRDTVLLTRELFTFKDEVNGGVAVKKLILGTKTIKLGELKFNPHREYGLPSQIVIGKKCNKWYVSFCYGEGNSDTIEQDLLTKYSSLDEDSLKEITIGIDRGIAIPFQTSQKLHYDFDKITKEKLNVKQKRLKRYQKKIAKQKKDSNSRNKTRKKLANLHNKIANIRHDFCHKTSHALVNCEAKVFAVEDLKLKNMTKSPAPKQDAQGKYLPNKKRAKAGLNRELLSKGLAKTIDFLEYKSLKYGKIVIKIDPKHSSQECANCGHTHPDNRKSQSIFSCLSCGNHDNADHNAAKVIAKRGVKFLLSKPKAKTRTRLGTSRSKAGRGTSKTKLDLSNPLVPMTPEACPL